MQYSASILGFYDRNYIKALEHLFPEVHFDETKFRRMPSMFTTTNIEAMKSNKIK